MLQERPEDVEYVAQQPYDEEGEREAVARPPQEVLDDLRGEDNQPTGDGDTSGDPRNRLAINLRQSYGGDGPRRPSSLLHSKKIVHFAIMMLVMVVVEKPPH